MYLEILLPIQKLQRKKWLLELGEYNKSMSIQKGDCVKIPDGRIARVREIEKDGYKMRVRRKTSKSHQFVTLKKSELTQVACPKGWMSSDGYNRYLKVTLAKMRIRNKK